MFTTANEPSLMRRLFRQNHKEEDFSTFLGKEKVPAKKTILLKECERYGVSPYVDDAAETSTGVYALLRGVASEAELERRLNAWKALGLARRAHIVAIVAFLVSLAALVKSLL